MRQASLAQFGIKSSKAKTETQRVSTISDKQQQPIPAQSAGAKPAKASPTKI